MNRRIVYILAGAVFFILIAVLFVPKNKAKNTSIKIPAYEAQAQTVLAQGNLLEAKMIYKKALEATEQPEEFLKIQKALEDINLKIIFSSEIDDCSVLYEVQPKDSLTKIAQKHGSTVELIKRVNNLSGDIIRVGQKLKVVTCKFVILVDKSQNMLFLKYQDRDEVIKSYVVSTGKNGSTPVGTFKIVNKLVDPVWYKAGAIIDPGSPDNILGTRWMGIEEKGYGIHGTTVPEDLGKAVTLGCVRMLNADVEELYDIVPQGTEVTIIE